MSVKIIHKKKLLLAQNKREIWTLQTVRPGFMSFFMSVNWGSLGLIPAYILWWFLIKFLYLCYFFYVAFFYSVWYKKACFDGYPRQKLFPFWMNLFLEFFLLDESDLSLMSNNKYLLWKYLNFLNLYYTEFSGFQADFRTCILISSCCDNSCQT